MRPSDIWTDPSLISGVGTDFTHSSFMVGGSIILSDDGKQNSDTQSTGEIPGSTQLRLRNAFNAPETVQRLTTKSIPSIKGTRRYFL